ncbi:MAG: dTDP-glucose 4,6-dehydratase [Flavobacteriales bacterium]|nr:dTDP-glucose 4,6-dehydratase [Flavobacteriales bacterium]
MNKNILITGGAGFIGSHVLRLMVKKYPEYTFTNLDALTYAGNLANLEDIEEYRNYTFVKGDINDKAFLKHLFATNSFDSVIHLAAESHVDRSISGPSAFIITNILGTAQLLDCAVENWKDKMEGKVFYHVSTDEVFGSLGATGKFSETTAYDPRSPYSASKASSDHIVRAFHHTYGLPILISNCSNNYGSHQFPEKLIPLIIRNITLSKPLPVYGKGENIRDWLWVDDHARAIGLIFHKGKSGETYCVGGNNEMRNIDMVKLLCKITDEELNRSVGVAEKLITFVTDRLGHDARYAIDATKISRDLGWHPEQDFEKAIRSTVRWYLDNTAWIENVTSGEYLKFYEEQYGNRS